ncbi:Gamma-glutamyltranspeptidase [Ophiocordyceps camponoti-floridani]|uniref:Gamma-glutamyltranspeptidase n=1 Tax=Ophiocordyceps camponoti-floridani TaxID=2030778 RepID=A0A8H4QAH1_9HYPO|nr:Gamma-glutamyltranspeptidase [Ophiocordyceps camponoti-floridani]
MYHSGIGGGGFMTIRAPDGRFETVDFREVAPVAAFEDILLTMMVMMAVYSGVPGEPRGLEYLHSKYGKLEWFQVVEPVVHLARFGFVVTGDLASRIASVEDASFLTQDASWALDFAPRGRLLQQGEVMTRKRYADTLEAIALRGVDAFYSGAIAQATIAGLRARNGTMTMEDLANYTVVHREPIPSQLSRLQADQLQRPFRWHRSSKRAQHSQQLRHARRPITIQPVNPPSRRGHQIRLRSTYETRRSVICRRDHPDGLDGLSRALSIPGVSNGFGYIPSPSNYIRPGKRPLSSISPIIAETIDGKLLFSLGAAGGSRITTATIQNTMHLLDRHLVPTTVTFEYAFDNSTVAYMKSLHHNASWVPPGQSLAQGVRLLSNGTFEAAGEPRLVASGGFAV